MQEALLTRMAGYPGAGKDYALNPRTAVRL
jgi:hypothetical protein